MLFFDSRELFQSMVVCLPVLGPHRLVVQPDTVGQFEETYPLFLSSFFFEGGGISKLSFFFSFSSPLFFRIRL